MRLGTRWSARTTPPPAVPDALRRGIAAVEETLPVDPLGQPTPAWTLTWLEGRPRAELDTGVLVSLDADGSVVVENDPTDGFG